MVYAIYVEELDEFINLEMYYTRGEIEKYLEEGYVPKYDGDCGVYWDYDPDRDRKQYMHLVGDDIYDKEHPY